MTCSRCNGSGVMLMYRLDFPAAPYAFKCKHEWADKFASIPCWDNTLAGTFTANPASVYHDRIVLDAFQSGDWDRADFKAILAAHRGRVEKEYREWKIRNPQLTSLPTEG